MTVNNFRNKFYVTIITTLKKKTVKTLFFISENIFNNYIFILSIESVMIKY